MNLWQLLILILAMSVGSAFAEETSDDADEEEAVQRVCVNKRTINSFDAIDDEHVYIKASSNKHFLFTMQRRCSGLRHANGIGIKDTMSQVCSKSFGEIVYRDMGRMQSCRIDTIEPVASKDDAKGLVKDRKETKSDD